MAICLSFSFNGAATCSLRKVSNGILDIQTDIHLQWGRNLFVAERGYWTTCPDSVPLLQWGRNLFVAESAGYYTLTVTESASLQWGRNLFVAESRHPVYDGVKK